MSRFGMGFGKDQAKHLLNSRPAVAVHSARCQQVHAPLTERSDCVTPSVLAQKGAIGQSDSPQLLHHRLGARALPGGPASSLTPNPYLLNPKPGTRSVDQWR